jgi:LPS-assembly lipoprotein
LLWLKNCIGIVLLLLVGCGFQPLYAPQQKINSEELHQIKIAIIADRSGQLLRNHLSFLLTPNGAPAHPKYILEITLLETRMDINLRRDATSRRAQITVKATYSLKSTPGGDLLKTAYIEETSGFSIGSQADFASLPAIVSEKDTRERLVEAIAQKLKLDLATFFLDQKTKETPVP